jgi:hypothetical protein
MVNGMEMGALSGKVGPVFRQKMRQFKKLECFTISPDRKVL